MLDIINTLLGRPLSAGKSFPEPLQLNVAYTPCVLGGATAVRPNQMTRTLAGSQVSGSTKYQGHRRDRKPPSLGARIRETSRSVELQGSPNTGEMAATSCKANMAADICQMLLFRCTFSRLRAAVGHLGSLFRPHFVCRARLSTNNGAPGAKWEPLTSSSMW
uniref:HDC13340 n=1 Tax=Drosophila melanogaster TaxID=7227 RepID=Q6IK58_DROME|nr:TPA_inf: HDC13340 [Drosophila melanogaster]